VEGLKFVLSGKSACFRKPDVNEFAYFTYHHIHKIALMGLVGSIIGLGGYSQQEEKNFPEFYEKLNEFFFSVVPPRNTRGFFTKKIQVFNNSVGYASREEGGNLIVREQWLEDPSWIIYVGKTEKADDELWIKMKEFLLNSKAYYIPYLGKNDHPATLSQVEEVNLNKDFKNDYFVIDSLYPFDEFEINSSIPIGFSERRKLKGIEGYLFKDYMPYKLTDVIGKKDGNIYMFKKYGYTDNVMTGNQELIWQDEKNNLKIVGL